MNAFTKSVDLVDSDTPASPVANGSDIFLARCEDIGRVLWPESVSPTRYERALCALVHSISAAGKRPNLHDLVPGMGHEVGLADIFNCFANMGFTTHGVDVSIGRIEPRLTPCLFVSKGSLFSNNQHIIVVLSIAAGPNGSAVTFYDTETHGIRTVDRSDPIFREAGRAYFLRKTAVESEATSAFQRQATKYSWFRALLTRFNREFFCIGMLSLALNALSLATPLFIMLTYDRVISIKSVDTLPILIVGAAAGIAFEWMLRTYRGRIIAFVAARIDWLVGTHIVEKLFSLPPVYAERATVSAQIARIKAFEAVREFFAGSSFFSAIELPFVVIAILAVGFVAGPLVMVPVVMMVPFLVLFYVMRKRIAVAMRIAAKVGSMRQKFLIASLGLVEQIDTNGLTEVWHKKHRSLTGREQNARFRLSVLSSIAEVCAHALLSFSAVLTLTFGVFLVWDGTITAGGLVASMILIWRILAPLYSLCTTISRFEQIRNSIRQVNQLMDIDGEGNAERNGARMQELRGGLEFENASVRYNADMAPILTSLSFNAKPGSLILVTGDSGAGKSSLLKLAQGMYTAQSGAVRLDGFDMRQLDAQSTRRRIGYVPQSPEFFSGSISENLRVSNPSATNDELWAILEEVGLAQEIRAYDRALETQISDIPSTKTLFLLSLARALLKESRLILIDKLPDSLLSGSVGSTVKNLILRQKGKSTVVMVVSRTDFFDIADLVVVLRRDRPSIVGTPDEVRPTIFVHTNAAAA